MKELSIEEKAKAYDEAISMAKKFYTPDSNNVNLKATLEMIFPKLAESEDEWIRKVLLSHFSRYQKEEVFLNNITMGDIVAWLEKQGKPIEINPSEFDSQLNRLLKQFESLPKEDLASSLSFYLNVVQNDGTYKEEKQGEQKSVNKVEPKFKVEKDKWYVCTFQYCNCIEGRNYKASLDGRIIDDYGTEYDMHDDAYRWFRPWTIQDAKDGDVLYENNTKTILIFKSQTCGWIKVYCDFWINKNKFTGTDPADYGKVSEMDLKPATKEQRDLLFQKMKEAGYEWDAENKELKKLKQKPAENEDLTEFDKAVGVSIGTWTPKTPEQIQSVKAVSKKLLKLAEKQINNEHKQEWSEEDETKLKDAIDACKAQYGNMSYTADWLKSLKERVQPQPRQEWSEEDERMLSCAQEAVKAYFSEIGNKGSVINWLKSLKERYVWKPSDEQMVVLNDIIINGHLSNANERILKGLQEQLKKLREE